MESLVYEIPKKFVFSFGGHKVWHWQVFFKTNFSCGFVNLRPVRQGHV